MYKSQNVEEGYSDQSLINDLLCVAMTLHTLLWLALSALLRQSQGQEAIHVLGDSSSPSSPSSRSSGGWSLRPLGTISRSRTPPAVSPNPSSRDTSTARRSRWAPWWCTRCGSSSSIRWRWRWSPSQMSRMRTTVCLTSSSQGPVLVSART